MNLSSSHPERSLTTTDHTNTHLGEPGQIDQGEVEHVGTVYPQVDRELRHAFVLSRDAERLLLDLAPNLGKVDETLVEV